MAANCAGLKPLQGEIIVDTNGGTMTVTLRADVPIKTFPQGPQGNDALAGARSPHEVALKARQHPLEAAALFGEARSRPGTRATAGPIPSTAPKRPAKARSNNSSKPSASHHRPSSPSTRRPCRSMAGSANELGKAHHRQHRRGQARCTRKRGARTIGSSSAPRAAWATAAQDPRRDLARAGLPGETLTTQVTIRGNGKQTFTVPVTLCVDKGPPVTTQSWGPFESGADRNGRQGVGPDGGRGHGADRNGGVAASARGSAQAQCAMVQAALGDEE